MVKRLIIDDERTFIDNHDDDITIHARSVSEAREYIISNEFDEVWFDFDMGNDTTGGLASDIEAGRVVLKGSPLVVIHTGNPVGRAHIARAVSGKYEIEHVFPGGYGGG